MQLDGLTDSDIDQIAAVFRSDIRDDFDLLRAGETIGQPDTHHEVLGRFAFPAFAAERTGPVALGIDAPPFEIGGGPFRKHRFPAAAKARISSHASHGFFSRLSRSMRWAFVSLTSAIDTFPRNASRKNELKTKKPACGWLPTPGFPKMLIRLNALGRTRAAR